MFLQANKFSNKNIFAVTNQKNLSVILSNRNRFGMTKNFIT